jgi:hypothetical protein
MTQGEVKMMKKVIIGLVILMALSTYSYASGEQNTVKGAAIGAAGGALLGQAIGRNTAGTLIGLAGGALVGAVAGNAVDQAETQKKLEREEALRFAQAAPHPPVEEGPPGEWVEVPGQWLNGKWIPPHRAWVPVNPPGSPPPEAAVEPRYDAPPAYAFPAPPEVVPVPGSYVYFVPGIAAEVLFYHGYWYRPYGGRWYLARSYNGPWGFVGPRGVPRALMTLPHGYRTGPPGFRPIPHAELQRNWGRWERERRWDGHRR